MCYDSSWRNLRRRFHAGIGFRQTGDYASLNFQPRPLHHPIDQIRTLVALSNGKGRCGDVHTLTVRHLADVRAKIADLRELERTLAKTAERCPRDASSECPIIDALSAPRRAT